jgi:hypothetical protein
MLACASLVCNVQCTFPVEQQGPLNPLLNYTTIRVRFLNLAGDNSRQKFELDYRLGRPDTTGDMEYAVLSEPTTPKSDSARVVVLSALDNSISATAATTTRFIGNNAVYTLIAIPSTTTSVQALSFRTESNVKKVAIPEVPVRRVDTVLALSSQADVLPEGTSRIRVVNCVYDQSLTFDLTIGCPSGDAVATALPFRSVSSYRSLSVQKSGIDTSITVSLVTRPRLGRTITSSAGTSMSATIVNGSYKIPMQSGQSYSVIIYRNKEGSVDILPINERRNETLQAVAGVSLAARLRVANFSALSLSSVDYVKDGLSAKNIALGISATRQSTPFVELTACQSVGNDTIAVATSINRLNVTTSLDAGKDYTLLLGRDAQGTLRSIVAPTLKTDLIKDSALVRVVNFSPQPVSVQRGVYKTLSNAVLFASLTTGSMSAAFTIPSGNCPFLAFSTTAPQTLLQTGVPTLEAGKSYLLVLAPDPSSTNGKGKMYLLADTEFVSSIDSAPEGAFLQFLNALSDGAQIRLELGDAPNEIGSIPLFYGTPQMTVLRAGSYQFKLPIKDGRITVKDNQRRVIVFTGNAMNQVFDSIVGMRDGVELSVFGERNFGDKNFVRPDTASMYRFMNAAQDFNRMYVSRPIRPGEGNTFTIGTTATGDIKPLSYRGIGFSRPFGMAEARRYELTFQSLDTIPSYAITIRDLAFQSNRAYSIIFTGRRFRLPMDTTLRNNYNAIILQEF